MFVRKKKFKRKKGNRYFYYLEKAVKVNHRHKMVTVKYLGDAERILRKFEQAEKYERDHKKLI